MTSDCCVFQFLQFTMDRKHLMRVEYKFLPLYCGWGHKFLNHVFKTTRSMETPREKELIRGEAAGEGSGLFEHSAANSSELTPAPHGRKTFASSQALNFFVCFEVTQPNAVLLYKTFYTL